MSGLSILWKDRATVLGCGSGNLETNCSVQHGGYVAELPPLKHRFNTLKTRNLFCLTATELACAMGEIMKLCVGDVR